MLSRIYGMMTMSNIIQTLIDTRVENPIEDVGGWVDRLAALGDGL